MLKLMKTGVASSKAGLRTFAFKVWTCGPFDVERNRYSSQEKVVSVTARTRGEAAAKAARQTDPGYFSAKDLERHGSSLTRVYLDSGRVAIHVMDGDTPAPSGTLVQTVFGDDPVPSAEAVWARYHPETPYR